MRKKIVIVALSALAIGLGVRGYIKISQIDKTGPVISFPEDVITYKEGDSYTGLLGDVKAIDTKDGDVTDSLIVEKVSGNDQEKQAIVTYAAIDRKNNLSKLSRVVQYIPKKKQEVKSKEEDSEDERGSEDGEKQPTTEDEKTMVLGQAPVMFLKTDLLTVKQNDRFTIRSFIARIIDDKDKEKVLMNNLKKNGHYTTRNKGMYEFVIYTVDSEGNSSNKERVTLVVN